MRWIKLTSFVLAGFLCIAEPAAWSDEPIGQILKAKEPVRVYIKDLESLIQGSHLDLEQLKKQLEKILLERKTLQFTLASDSILSDIIIECQLLKYQYMEAGPLKMMPNILLTTADAIATSVGNYAEMSAQFTVTEPETGRLLWQDTIEAYAKKRMNSEEGVGVVYDKVLKNFIRSCFGKPKNI